jgi:hypothetical protein
MKKCFGLQNDRMPADSLAGSKLMQQIHTKSSRKLKTLAEFKFLRKLRNF